MHRRVVQILPNHSGSIVTSSTILVATPSLRFFKRSQRRSPSIRSIGGAPSRVASFFASAVNVPVVINNPLSVRTNHRPAKIPDGAGGNAAFVLLALAVDLE